MTAVLGGVAGAAPLVDRELTLNESVKLAQDNSQLLMTAREDGNIALQRVQQAAAQFYPMLDLNANWSKFGVEGDTPLMLQPSLGPTLVPNSPRENYYTVRANIYQSVYEGGRSRNTWRQARIAYERAQDLADTLRVQVSGAAKQAYFDLLLAHTRNQRLVEAARATSGRRIDGGLLDRVRAEHWRSQLRSEAAEAEQAETTARLNYIRALNLELGTVVAIEGELKTQPIELELPKLLAWASRSRSELRQTEYQQQSDALGIRLSLSERVPRLSLGATYERTGYDVELPIENWAGTLNVNLPLSVSDIFFGWAKVKERKAQYRQATLRHAETADQIEKQVRQGYENYRFWQNEIPRRQEERDRFGELLRQGGAARLNAAERLEAEYYRVQADLRYLEAVHGHLWALAELERATGRALEEN